MTITAAQVKELRERTGAGMMECKKALSATNGDMELAIEELRKSCGAKADKKAGRIAAEGIIVIQTSDDGKNAAIIEINSETDFVARDANFLEFANAAAKTALQAKAKDVDVLMKLPLGNTTIEEARKALVAKVGENVNVRRLVLAHAETGALGIYQHGSRIGVVVELDVEQKELAKDIAMHIAASKPLVISPDQVPADLVEKEKEIYRAQAETSGKPQDIIEKMITGRVKKFLDEMSLLGQPFVKDPDVTVAGLLSKNRARVVAFTRFEVGEGIEKHTEDFAEAVMSQVQGS